MGQRIERALNEVEDAGQADNKAVNLAKSLEAEDLGRVVGHRSIVERSIHDEEEDIADCRPHVWQTAEHSDDRCEEDQ